MKCNYCKDNNCKFSDIIRCKHKELMDENRELETRLKDTTGDLWDAQENIGKFNKAIQPIMNYLDKGGDASSAIDEFKKLYDEYELFDK